jgi:hypothetical protein
MICRPFFTDGIYFTQPASPRLRGISENTTPFRANTGPEGSDQSDHPKTCISSPLAVVDIVNWSNTL